MNESVIIDQLLHARHYECWEEKEAKMNKA